MWARAADTAAVELVVSGAAAACGGADPKELPQLERPGAPLALHDG